MFCFTPFLSDHMNQQTTSKVYLPLKLQQNDIIIIIINSTNSCQPHSFFQHYDMTTRQTACFLSSTVDVNMSVIITIITTSIISLLSNKNAVLV